ncbi:MAG TPA: lipopolysaccharide biosynthesis protein [Allosphingosinicella sp.]|jgi:O-antigen/teichoic acid export membrane protein
MSALASLKSFVVERQALLMASLSSLALRVAGLVSTFALGVTLARMLGPAGYGIYGLVITVVALVMNVALLGTPQLAVRELSIRDARGEWADLKRLTIRFPVAVTAASLILAGGAAALMLVWRDQMTGEQLAAGLLGAALMPAMALTMLLAAELRGLAMIVKGQLIDNFARPGLSFVFTLGIVLGGVPLGPAGAIGIQLTVAVAAVALSLWWVWKALPEPARHAGPGTARIQWLSSALPLGVVDALRQLDGAYGVILMGWLASDVDLGVFRVAVACGTLVNMPLTIAHVVFAPTITRLFEFDRRDELQTLLSAASGAMVFVLSLAVLASWTIGRPLIIFVFGHAYADAWLPLFLISVAQLIWTFFGMGPILLAMCQGERHLTKIYAVAEGAAILAAVPLIRSYGAAGAAAAQMVSAALIGFLSWRYARKVLGLELTFLPLLRAFRRAPMRGSEAPERS